MIKIELPLTKEKISSLKAGDSCLLNGELLVGRDQAHLRLCNLLDSGKDLPVNISNETIFYMGPSPTPPGELIGACGPTTAYRMDPFAPKLLENGLLGMIGKGPRNEEVRQSIIKNGAVYFYSYGGCGALYAEAVKGVEVVAFEDLGPEAILKLKVVDFPVIVAIDYKGDSIYSN